MTDSDLARLIDEQAERDRQASQARAGEALDVAVAARQAEGDYRSRDELIAEGRRRQERERLAALGVELRPE